jgi:hypothetical protein
MELGFDQYFMSREERMDLYRAVAGDPPSYRQLKRWENQGLIRDAELELMRQDFRRRNGRRWNESY